MYYIDADLAAVAANGAEAQQQAVCTEFTEHAQVYAVATAIGNFNLFHECLAQHDTPLFSGGDAKAQSLFEAMGPYFYMPGELNFTRVMRHYGDGLARLGFFDDLGPNADPLATEPVIGLIYGDEPNEEESITLGLEPALAAHGHSITERYAITPGSTSQYANAVLQFRAAGVTHVLFGFQGGAVLFAPAAESQGYRPLYGLHSRQSPASVLQGNVTADHLRGSKGVGWQPYNDVNANNDPGILNGKQQTCLDIMAGAGEDTSVWCRPYPRRCDPGPLVRVRRRLQLLSLHQRPIPRRLTRLGGRLVRHGSSPAHIGVRSGSERSQRDGSSPRATGIWPRRWGSSGAGVRARCWLLHW